MIKIASQTFHKPSMAEINGIEGMTTTVRLSNGEIFRRAILHNGIGEWDEEVGRDILREWAAQKVLDRNRHVN